MGILHALGPKSAFQDMIGKHNQRLQLNSLHTGTGNFWKEKQTKRSKWGKTKRWKGKLWASHKTLRTAPAMAANITKRLWEIGDIIDVLETWEANIAKKIVS